MEPDPHIAPMTPQAILSASPISLVNSPSGQAANATPTPGSRPARLIAARTARDHHAEPAKTTGRPHAPNVRRGHPGTTRESWIKTYSDDEASLSRYSTFRASLEDVLAGQSGSNKRAPGARVFSAMRTDWLSVRAPVGHEPVRANLEFVLAHLPASQWVAGLTSEMLDHLSARTPSARLLAEGCSAGVRGGLDHLPSSSMPW
jgi:hypothetical protein